jgi:hypothetical protein
MQELHNGSRLRLLACFEHLGPVRPCDKIFFSVQLVWVFGWTTRGLENKTMKTNSRKFNLLSTSMAQKSSTARPVVAFQPHPRNYFTETPIKADERPEAVEVAVSADLSLHGLPTLIGILDLVRSGGRIVDFKLVGKTPDPEMVAHTTEIQLTCYSLLYRDATGRQEGGLELHHLVRTKAPKLVITSLPPATPQQRNRLFRQIESYREGLDRRDFVPSPGFACMGCEFFNECRRKWEP